MSFSARSGASAMMRFSTFCCPACRADLQTSDKHFCGVDAREVPATTNSMPG